MNVAPDAEAMLEALRSGAAPRNVRSLRLFPVPQRPCSIRADEPTIAVEPHRYRPCCHPRWLPRGNPQGAREPPPGPQRPQVESLFFNNGATRRQRLGTDTSHLRSGHS